MQVRTASSPAELRDAAWILRSRYFWWQFSARNIHAVLILLVLFSFLTISIVNRQMPKWEDMGGLLFGGAFFSLMVWYRWNKTFKKAAAALKPRSGMMLLDSDGVRTTLESGATSFVPWSSYTKCVEGKSVFVLTGSDGPTILPIDEGNRDSLRGLLQSRIAGMSAPTR